jgi:hypothetical protein
MSIGSIVISENPVTQAGGAYSKTHLPHDWIPGSYGHEIRSMGGFWRARFTLRGIVGKEYELEQMLNLGLGRHMEAFSPGGVLVWQGFVNELRLSTPSLDYSVSLSDFANRVWVRFDTTINKKTGATLQIYDAEGIVRARAGTDAGDPSSTSTVYDNLSSQARYGIKEEVISGGENNATAANAAAQMFLARLADPLRGAVNIRQGGSGDGEVTLEVGCRGYWETLDWRVYNQTALTGNEDISVMIPLVVSASGAFVDGSRIAANSMELPREFDSDRRAGSILFDFARAGDASANRYVVGIYEGRQLIYEQAKGFDRDNVDYSIYTKGRERLIKGSGGRGVLPSEVRPNRWAYVEDLFLAEQRRSTLSADLRAVYIDAVTYREPDSVDLRNANSEELQTIVARAAYSGVSKL